MIIALLFAAACICSFLIGMHINIAHAKHIDEELNTIGKSFKRCSHKYERKRVGDVDGYVWRDVCRRCGKTKQLMVNLN